MTEIFENSPMPNHKMTRGTNAIAGMGRRNANQGTNAALEDPDAADQQAKGDTDIAAEKNRSMSGSDLRRYDRRAERPRIPGRSASPFPAQCRAA